MSGMAEADLRVEFSRLEGRVNGMEARLDDHIAETREYQKQNRATHAELYQRTERPSWTVTTVISVLTGLVAALGVWALTN